MKDTASRDLLAPAPYGATPTDRQLRWHDHEFYGFLHFGVNTFTNMEWGYGDEDPGIFNPTDFDAAQIAGVAAESGMAGLILTCKHHDGFCLWPSRYTEHSVKNSPWQAGSGDIVRSISDACGAAGIRFGAYLSPWDRNHREYGGPGYVEYYRNQLRELTTGYGDIFEVWFDGANGGDGYYGGTRELRQIERSTYYDWQNTWQIVRENQPGAVMFSDAGPDVRWVGNESGVAGDPCWSTLTKEALYPGFGGDDFTTTFESDIVKAWASDQEMLNQGEQNGSDWLPAECDVSIRPGWFYHSSEDAEVRTASNLLDLYYKSVGRGASFLLNLPPDTRGRIHEQDVQSLLGFRKRLDAIFAANFAANAAVSSEHVRGRSELFSASNLIDGDPETYWSPDDNTVDSEVVFELPAEITFNVLGLREYISLGQRVENFAVDVREDGNWKEYHRGAAIGNRRLVKGKASTTNGIRLRFFGNPVCPAITEFGLYLDQ